jgi:hypothetical protein
MEFANSFPAYEGASLVVAGTGTNTVSLYDKGLPGTTIGAGFNYTLFVATGTTSFSRFDNINADGQLGSSISPFIAGERDIVEDHRARLARSGLVALRMFLTSSRDFLPAKKSAHCCLA